MTEDLHDDTQADSALDRKIEALLAVDPSPEYVVQVRARSS